LNHTNNNGGEMPEKILYNIGEACKILGLTRNTFKKVQQEIPSVSLGTGKPYYTKDALLEWAKAKQGEAK
jgi:hypothetical protein